MSQSIDGAPYELFSTDEGPPEEPESEGSERLETLDHSSEAGAHRSDMEQRQSWH